MDDVRTEYSDQPIRYEIENVPLANTTFLWHIATYIMLQRTTYLHSYTLFRLWPTYTFLDVAF